MHHSFAQDHDTFFFFFAASVDQSLEKGKGKLESQISGFTNNPVPVKDRVYSELLRGLADWQTRYGTSIGHFRIAESRYISKSTASELKFGCVENSAFARAG